MTDCLAWVAGLSVMITKGVGVEARLTGRGGGSGGGGGACHTGGVSARRSVHVPSLIALAGTALLGLALDQATKALVVATREGKPPIRVIGRVLTIDVSRNSGAAFSFAPAATVVFTALAVATVVVIVTKISRLHSISWAIALGLVLAGAVGNLCDRLVRAPGFGRGAVVDFIDLQHFAVFNVADSCLTCGAILAVLLSLRGIPMTREPRPSADPDGLRQGASNSTDGK
jgi:signal peptidase II